MFRILRGSFVMPAMILLAACGGGNGSGTVGVGPVRPDGNPPPGDFTSFPDVQAGQGVESGGISQTVTATSSNGSTIDSRVVNAPQEGDTVEIFLDAQRQPNFIAIHSARADLIWSGASQVVCGPELCLAQNAQTLGALGNATGGLGWNFQTFGYWLDSPTLNTRELGAISVGNPTPAGGLPVSGGATYDGLSAGLYVDPSGAVFEHVADMRATADFGPARSVTFLTSRTQLSSLQGGLTVASPEFDLRGTLAITGSNQVSGSLSTRDTTLTGTATGRFYGPLADEIGGVYTLTRPGGSTVETFTGGFGGRQ